MVDLIVSMVIYPLIKKFGDKWIDRIAVGIDKKVIELLKKARKGTKEHAEASELLRDNQIIDSALISAVVNELEKDYSDTITYFELLQQACYFSYQQLEAELLLLSSAMLESWIEISTDNNGSIDVDWVHNNDGQAKVADLVMEKILIDNRWRKYYRAEYQKSPPEKRMYKFIEYFHFDKDLFVNGNEYEWGRQPWSLNPMRSKSPLTDSSDWVQQLFNIYIPSQYVMAISRFVIQWTSLVPCSMYNHIVDYLHPKYVAEDATVEDKQRMERFWKGYELRTKALIVYEMLGIMSRYYFFCREQYVKDDYPLIYKAVHYAFDPKRYHSDRL